MVRYYSELKKEIFAMEKVYSNKINLLKALAIITGSNKRKRYIKFQQNVKDFWRLISKVFNTKKEPTSALFVVVNY